MAHSASTAAGERRAAQSPTPSCPAALHPHAYTCAARAERRSHAGRQKRDPRCVPPPRTHVAAPCPGPGELRGAAASTQVGAYRCDPRRPPAQQLPRPALPYPMTAARLRGGGDAERVEAAAGDLRDVQALQRLERARLDPGWLRALALPALPLAVAAPGDDVVRRQRDRVLRAARLGLGSEPTVCSALCALRTPWLAPMAKLGRAGHHGPPIGRRPPRAPPRQHAPLC